MSRDRSPVFVSPRISVTVAKFRHSVFLPSTLIGPSSAGFVVGLAGSATGLAGSLGAVDAGMLVAAGVTDAATGALAGVVIVTGGGELGGGGGVGDSATGCCCSACFATSSAVNAGMTDCWLEAVLDADSSAFGDFVSATTAAVNLLDDSIGS